MKFLSMFTLAMASVALAAPRAASDSTTAVAETGSTEAPATTSAAPAETGTETVAETGTGTGEAAAECKTIAELLDADENASIIAGVVADLNLTDRFNSTDGRNLTVFLPANTALEGLDLSGVGPADLFQIISYHVVPGIVLAADLTDGAKLEPFWLGAELDVSVADGVVKVGNATVVNPDVIACNGVVHIIDSVILPPVPAEPEAPVSTETPATTTEAAGTEAPADTSAAAETSTETATSS